MPYRWTRLRKVDRNGSTGVSGEWPISLSRAALCAAEETIQGSPFASAWLRLFQDHLSTCEPSMLRWRGNLGSSSEVRRAYSGLYGRYFARALLAGELGITDFIPLDLPHETYRKRNFGAVTVCRVSKGDVPDWIAWDPRRPGHVLCEAKGRMTGRTEEFLTSEPACINEGKAQFARVEVRDSGNRRVATRNWVAVNRWSTDVGGGQAVSLLWDPPSDGEFMTPEEAHGHGEAMRRHRLRVLARGLGNPDFIVRIRVSGADGEMPSLVTDAKRDSPFSPFERPSREPHEGCYQAAIITPLGIRAIRDGNDLNAARAVADGSASADEAVMIFGLAKGTSKTAESGQARWLSNNGIVSADGSALFDLKSVDVEEA